MSQQTDLPPLSPSLRDVFGTWLRPWKVIGLVTAKVAPVALPAVVVWLTGDAIVGSMDSAEMQAAFTRSTTETTVMSAMDLLPVVLVVTMVVILASMLTMTR